MPLNQEQIEAFFLNHDDPVYEEIQEADTEEQAEDIADHALREAGQDYDDTKDLVTVVRKIRSA